MILNWDHRNVDFSLNWLILKMKLTGKPIFNSRCCGDRFKSNLILNVSGFRFGFRRFCITNGCLTVSISYEPSTNTECKWLWSRDDCTKHTVCGQLGRQEGEPELIIQNVRWFVRDICSELDFWLARIVVDGPTSRSIVNWKVISKI